MCMPSDSPYRNTEKPRPALVPVETLDVDVDKLTGFLSGAGLSLMWFLCRWRKMPQKFAAVMEIEVLDCDWRGSESVGTAMMNACEREGKTLRWLVEHHPEIVEEEIKDLDVPDGMITYSRVWVKA